MHVFLTKNNCRLPHEIRLLPHKKQLLNSKRSTRLTHLLSFSPRIEVRGLNFALLVFGHIESSVIDIPVHRVIDRAYASGDILMGIESSCVVGRFSFGIPNHGNVYAATAWQVRVTIVNKQNVDLLRISCRTSKSYFTLHKQLYMSSAGFSSIPQQFVERQ